MKRESVAFLLALSSAGCAFQPSPEPAALAGPALSLAVDWAHEPSPELGKRVKATRSLVSAGGSAFRTQEAITLPVEVPRTLYLAVEMPASTLTAPVEFVRAQLEISSDKSFHVVSSLVAVEQLTAEKYRAILQVAGLNALFLSDRSQTGSLQFRFYSRSTLMAEAEIALRTPPSRLEWSTLTLRAWARDRDDSRLALERPEILGRHLNLLRVIRIKNLESTRVELQLPRFPDATLKQWINPLVHQDPGCGYRVNESPRWDLYSESILFLPLDSELFIRAADVLSKPALKDRIPVQVEPNGSAEVGVYAVGQGADQWMSKGPLGPELSQIRVPGDCYNVCVSTWCSPTHCRACKRVPVEVAPWIMGSKDDLTIMGCHCDGWETRRHDATITVGVNRGPVLLEVTPHSATWPVRFSDLDFSSDGQVRSISFSTTSSEVLWR